MRPNRPTSRRGYSLMEMIIVVTMIAIITAFAMPKIDYQAYRQDAAARAIRGALQQAQSSAVGSQHEVWVVVDQTRNRLITVQDPTDSNQYVAGDHYAAVPMQDGVVIGLGSATSLPGGGAITNGFSAVPAAKVSPGVLSGQSTGFVFRADGAVSSPVQIYVTSTRGLAKDSRALNVIQATGRVDWYKYVNSQWVPGGF